MTRTRHEKVCFKMNLSQSSCHILLLVILCLMILCLHTLTCAAGRIERGLLSTDCKRISDSLHIHSTEVVAPVSNAAMVCQVSTMWSFLVGLRECPQPCMKLVESLAKVLHYRAVSPLQLVPMHNGHFAQMFLDFSQLRL